MSDSPFEEKLNELADGRTELVFDLLPSGVPANHKDDGGVSLIQHCAYYGDVLSWKHATANDCRFREHHSGIAG